MKKIFSEITQVQRQDARQRLDCPGHLLCTLPANPSDHRAPQDFAYSHPLFIHLYHHPPWPVTSHPLQLKSPMSDPLNSLLPVPNSLLHRAAGPVYIQLAHSSPTCCLCSTSIPWTHQTFSHLRHCKCYFLPSLPCTQPVCPPTQCFT